MLQLTQIDLAELAQLLDQRDYPSGYLDPDTGGIHHCFDGEMFDEEGETAEPEDHWLELSGGDSREAYRDMVDFADAIADGALRGRLLQALEGKGAFRRFRDVVHNTPERLGPTWNRFSTARSEARALDWLQSLELVPHDQVESRRTEISDAADAVLAELGAGTGARLILLNGLPGVGKSAVAREYVGSRSGALDLDVDVLRSLLGGPWDDTAELGRTRALELATVHLRDGHDVVVPQLVADADQLDRFREAADEAGARFVHVVLAGPAHPATEPWQLGIGPDEIQAYAARLDPLRAADDVLDLTVTSPEETADALGVLVDPS